MERGALAREVAGTNASSASTQQGLQDAPTFLYHLVNVYSWLLNIWPLTVDSPTKKNAIFFHIVACMFTKGYHYCGTVLDLLNAGAPPGKKQGRYFYHRSNSSCTKSNFGNYESTIYTTYYHMKSAN